MSHGRPSHADFICKQDKWFRPRKRNSVAPITQTVDSTFTSYSVYSTGWTSSLVSTLNMSQVQVRLNRQSS